MAEKKVFDILIKSSAFVGAYYIGSTAYDISLPFWRHGSSIIVNKYFAHKNGRIPLREYIPNNEFYNRHMMKYYRILHKRKYGDIRDRPEIPKDTHIKTAYQSRKAGLRPTKEAIYDNRLYNKYMIKFYREQYKNMFNKPIDD